MGSRFTSAKAAIPRVASSAFCGHCSWDGYPERRRRRSLSRQKHRCHDGLCSRMCMDRSYPHLRWPHVILRLDAAWRGKALFIVFIRIRRYGSRHELPRCHYPIPARSDPRYLRSFLPGSWFMSSIAMRMNRRGSTPSRPEAGQPEEQSPQLGQES